MTTAQSVGASPPAPEKPKSLLDKAKEDIQKKKKTPSKKKKSSTKPKKSSSKPKKVAVPKGLIMKISDIVLPKNWNREEMGDISDLIASMKSRGQLQPVLVRKVAGLSKGQVELVAGMRRIAAAKELKWTEVKVTYTDTTDDGEAFLDSVIENETRRANTPYERVMFYYKLSTQFEMTNEAIAKACGKTPGQVSQHLAVTKSSKTVQNLFKKGKLPLHFFRYYNKLDQSDDKDKALGDKVVAGVSSGKMTVSDAADKIDTHLKQKAAKEAAKAAKAGKPKPKAAPRKGAAAHKKKKAPPIELTDYHDKETRKLYKMLTLKGLIKTAEHYGEQLQAATKKEQRAHKQGVIDGLEMAMGLIEVDLGDED